MQKPSFALVLAILWTLCLLPSAHAENPDCGTTGKSWERLVEDFELHWSPPVDFCQYKRFLALNDMIKRDMNQDIFEYYQRIEPLQARHDQSEPINFLLMQFQQTWFGLSVEKVLSQEYPHKAELESQALWISAAGFVAFAAANHFLPASSKSMGLLRGMTQVSMQKRVLAFTLTSVLGEGPSLRVLKPVAPGVEVDFVSPPLLSKDQNGPMDPSARDFFLNLYHEDLAEYYGKMGLIFLTSHIVSLRIKAYAPSWSTLFPHAKWPTHRVPKYISPGIVGGVAVGLPTSFLLNRWTPYLEQSYQYHEYSHEVKSLANSLVKAIEDDRQMDAWQTASRLNNQLLLMNEVETHSFNQSLANEAVRSADRILEAEALCVDKAEDIFKAEQKEIASRMIGILGAERSHLESALGVISSAQEILINSNHPLVKPVLELSNTLLTLNHQELSISFAADLVWQAVRDAIKDREPLCEQSTRPVTEIPE